jgi:DNA-directed RNA polymerase specialized sigma24 family protein
VKPAPSIADLIASLPEEERFILTLHYLKGMDSDAIAVTLGVPNKAVVSVIDGGKKRLLAALDFPPFP